MNRKTGDSLSLKAYLELLGVYLSPHKARVVVLAILLFAGIAIQLVNPQIMRRFLDAAQSPDSPRSVLLHSALLFCIFAVLHQLVTVFATYVGNTVAWLATNALRNDLAGHCLSLDMSFHNRHSPGELIERIDGDINTLSNFFSQFAVQIIGNGLLLIGIIVMLFLTDIRVGIPMTLFVISAFVLVLKLRDFGSSLWEKRRQAQADLFGYLEERIQGTEDIRACGAQGYIMRGFYTICRRVLRTTVRAITISAGITHNISHIVFVLGSTSALAIGIFLFYRNIVTLGTLYIIFHYSSMLAGPINRMTGQIRDLQQATAGINRVRNLLGEKSRITDGSGGITIGRDGPLAVVFEKVDFAYQQGENEQVLHDISFRLKPGTVLGLLGRTGSGKTTIGRLLFRLYDADQGAILIGREGELQDLRRLPVADVRSRIGMVTQNVELFDASVRDNLTFFGDSDARLESILSDLGLEEWYLNLPEGLDTKLTNDRLSAGQAQLLAFARVFLQEPQLLVLDEASSRLDPASERLVRRSLDRLLAGRTAVVIAHRLETVRRADNIMILSEGRISEYGRRTDLENDPASRFSRLLEDASGRSMEEALA